MNRFFTTRSLAIAAIVLSLATATASAASAVIFYGSVVLPAYSAGNPASTTVNIHNDNASTNGMVLNVPTSSTNGFQFNVGGTTVGEITGSGLTNMPVSGSNTSGNVVCTGAAGILLADVTDCGATIRTYTSAGQMAGVNYVNATVAGCTFASSTSCTTSFSFLKNYTANAICTATPEQAFAAAYTSVIIQHTGSGGFTGVNATLSTASSVSGTVAVDIMCIGD